jgi:hypothetical protein
MLRSSTVSKLYEYGARIRAQSCIWAVNGGMPFLGHNMTSRVLSMIGEYCKFYIK